MTQSGGSVVQDGPFLHQDGVGNEPLKWFTPSSQVHRKRISINLKVVGAEEGYIFTLRTRWTLFDQNLLFFYTSYHSCGKDILTRVKHFTTDYERHSKFTL